VQERGREGGVLSEVVPEFKTWQEATFGMNYIEITQAQKIYIEESCPSLPRVDQTI
jgi:hypothetical protein